MAEVPGSWRVYRGVAGLWYAQRLNCSPPVIVRSEDFAELPPLALAVIADRRARAWQDTAARQRGCDLADLRLFWGDWYDIDWDGVCFVATRRDDDVAVPLRASTKLGLHQVMLADHMRRPVRAVPD